ncbi:hypothetical protein DFS34DRAFT_121496 [Phlyctochytrium arcticum]|nr:hypothetical protein DFS34DRAFT_121496 [Phlyctochytrium arcticum]
MQLMEDVVDYIVAQQSFSIADPLVDTMTLLKNMTAQGMLASANLFSELYNTGGATLTAVTGAILGVMLFAFLVIYFRVFRYMVKKLKHDKNSTLQLLLLIPPTVAAEMDIIETLKTPPGSDRSQGWWQFWKRNASRELDGSQTSLTTKAVDKYNNNEVNYKNLERGKLDRIEKPGNETSVILKTRLMYTDPVSVSEAESNSDVPENNPQKTQYMTSRVVVLPFEGFPHNKDDSTIFPEEGFNTRYDHAAFGNSRIAEWANAQAQQLNNSVFPQDQLPRSFSRATIFSSAHSQQTTANSAACPTYSITLRNCQSPKGRL